MSTTDIIDKAHEQYVKDIEKSSKKLTELLGGILAKYSHGGELKSNNSISGLDQDIKKAIDQSGINKATDTFLQAYDKVDASNMKWYDSEGIQIKTLLGSDVLKYMKDKIIFDLKGEGARVNIQKPLEDALKENIFLNRTFTEANKVIKTILIENPQITKYAGETALKSLDRYNAITNNIVKVKHDLKWFKYIGSEIEETRPICDHLRDLGNRAISEDELQKILDEFCPNGKPSEKMITYTTVNNKTFTKKKGSGMMEGTFVYNFAEKKGGYRCRHDVKYTLFPKD